MGCACKHLFNMPLNCAISFLKLVKLCGKLLKILPSRYNVLL